MKSIDHKDQDTLRKFTDSLAKILPRKKSGLCAKHQRQMVQAIKRARFLAIMAAKGE